MPIAKSIAGLLLLFLCAAASAQVYQWKDKNGRTIISDSPPPPSVKSRVLAPEQSASSTQKSLADQDQDFRKRQQEAQNRSEQEAKEKAANAQRKSYCDDARRQLALLQSGERIVTREVNGERSFMDDDKRAQEAANTQRLIDDNCQGF